jgi:hypothetical protein
MSMADWDVYIFWNRTTWISALPEEITNRFRLKQEFELL